jgi:hypothetical protein
MSFLFAEHQTPKPKNQKSHEPGEDLKTTMKTANDTGVLVSVGLPSLPFSKLRKQLGTEQQKTFPSPLLGVILSEQDAIWYIGLPSRNGERPVRS